MTGRFKLFIDQHGLCTDQQRIMLAVSGGIDSVVMTDLFCTNGYNCSVLHCNFGLRGEESEGDEAYVRSLAARYDLPVYVKKFKSKEYAEENGISIQMAARELRYRWFDDISQELNVKVIATAHNLNDSVETVLLNLCRGTGIKGLTGIPPVNGKYIRPLLFATRKEILGYGRIHHLQYREDSSNASKKYHRNKLRHDIIPVFEGINPSFIRTMGENIGRFSESHAIYSEQVLKKRNEICIKKENHIEVNIRAIKELRPIGSWLYELFSEFEFSTEQCLNIENILDSESGKQFISPTHRLFRDREKFLICKIEDTAFERYYIDSPESEAALPFSMDIEVLDRSSLESFPDSENIACLDLEKLNFPLILRRWQHGDYFFPLGMEQMKKVSDFYIDNKIPVPLKKTTWLLTSGKKIVWIVGLRIDNRFKITETTQKILRLHYYDQTQPI
ncbi:MAG: tRNA lysidine(34) synthetase TilS [Bacteroidales bacterium]